MSGRLERRSVRLRDYDYSRAGAYFVTICTKNQECILGRIVGEKMHLSHAGEIVESIWRGLPSRFPQIKVDWHIIMPNHFHGIVEITESSESVQPTVGAGLALPTGAASRAPTLGTIIGAFKSISAIKVNRLLSRVNQPLWQRNYYEHVIRNNHDLNMVRTYITANPMQWESKR